MSYLVQWRTSPGSPRRTLTRTFHDLPDAEAFKAKIEVEAGARRRKEVFEVSVGEEDDPIEVLSARTLGEALTLLRRRSGMKREHLAKAAQVSPGALWGWESDRTTPKIQHLRPVIQVLSSKTGDDFDRTWLGVRRLVGKR